MGRGPSEEGDEWLCDGWCGGGGGWWWLVVAVVAVVSEGDADL